MIKRTGGKWEGYSIFATNALTEEEWFSYTEADNVQLALERCKDQFPEEEGWIGHWVMNPTTQEEFYKPLDDVLPLN